MLRRLWIFSALIKGELSPMLLALVRHVLHWLAHQLYIWDASSPACLWVQWHEGGGLSNSWPGFCVATGEVEL